MKGCSDERDRWDEMEKGGGRGMTDDAKGPEVIWAWRSASTFSHWTDRPGVSPTVRYARADIADELAEALRRGIRRSKELRDIAADADGPLLSMLGLDALADDIDIMLDALARYDSLTGKGEKKGE